MNMATQHETKTPTINQTTLKRGIKIMKILTEQISGSFRLNATTSYTIQELECLVMTLIKVTGATGVSLPTQNR